MQIKILSQKENKLLHRKELQVRVTAQGGTAKREEMAGKLAAMLNVDKNAVVVENIYQQFGSQNSNSYVKVYETAEHLQKTEPKKKEKKGKEGAAPAAAPAPAAKPEEKKEEKPAEKKEEKPAEAKKEEKK